MLRQIQLLITALFMALVMPLAVGAQNLPELNLSKSGLALRGVDPVSYFTAGKPVKGSAEISTQHEGGTYHFASEQSKATFLSDPAKYLPAFGGYCAYGTAVGAKVDGNPNHWNIVEGQLYLNITHSVDRTWKRNTPKYIAQAEQNWPDLKSK